MGSRTEIIYRDIAPGAAEAASVSAEGAGTLSDLSQMPLEGLIVKAGLPERNYWILDGTADITDGSPVAAFVSEQISDIECVLQAAPVITISFSENFTSPGVTLEFDTVSGEWCSSINIKWYQGSSLKADSDFMPDSPVYFCSQSAEAFDRIVITVGKTSMPYRRAKIRRILIGVVRTFGMSEIRNASITCETSLISTELPISALSWTLDSRENIDFLFQNKQPIEVKNNDSLIGVFYVTKAARNSGSVYNISCEDAFGVLEDIPFPGGAYLNGISAETLTETIVGSEFDVVFDKADTVLKGIIQSGTKRAALQQVLFAWGAAAIGDGEKIRIVPLGDTLSEIGADRTYTGVTVDTDTAVTEVRVSAHTYTQDSGGGIEVGSTKYSETVTEYIVQNPNATGNSKENVITVDNATLVSADIGQAAAQRVYDYYMRRNTGKGKIVWNGEKPGDYVSIPNAWGGITKGHIAKMEITLSNTVAADLTVIGTEEAVQ